MCTRQSRKVIIIRYEQYTVPDTVAVETTFVAFLYHSQIYVHGLSCHSFKFLWRTVNSKPPTIPFGIVACTFSDSLSRNSCLRPATDLWVKSYANEEKVNNGVSKESPIEGTSYLGGEGGVSHGTLWDYLLRVLDSSQSNLAAFYHLHGQTSRSTVWANGSQNSGVVNFIPESRLPFAQSVPFTVKRPRRPDTGISVALKKWNTVFRL